LILDRRTAQLLWIRCDPGGQAGLIGPFHFYSKPFSRGRRNLFVSKKEDGWMDYVK